MMQDGSVLFGLASIAREISRLTGKEVSEKTAAYWAKRHVFRSRKCGHFVVSTKETLAEDFRPEPDAAA